MKKILPYLLCLIIANQLLAQKPFKKNTVYAEILGNGIVLSANYEKQVGSKEGLGVHIGIGLGGNKPAIPLGLKYLFGLGNNKSFLETGLGITFGERDLWIENNNQVSKKSYNAAFIPSVGYRHHTNYGLMWRINYTPVFSSYRNLIGFAGISIGWRL
jgi:hypothetical protein